ncbi:MULTISPECIES: uridine diphosphate-N-acetylglucosamine-binding protein YvcK [unclassified Arsenophonus]|uniref:gluconeogenesis factor YvcK family protein n=1 Tax=unclassified Arsenophonus TaxID=2627083 RepID=UPI0028673A67|nr:uridine diphosphate-N-acetylglucosamine-binding protein YvcK [Arsenophonus sp.]MDR5610223.1 uridine diphosphate-N-acetylglucosamine-binding protein YvcK [Arsenophonus sp.]MDR5614000.1 uridine diphosphate-N-acetylglucosamine-binding protein YvcK [Arsenophonus sp.]
MHNRSILNNLGQVVALGGGHGLGRVMSSLAFLNSQLTGIVTTTDDGGSTGRIRRSEGGIAWGDTRNCLNQLITEPSIASTMFEYRFAGNGELGGHNLGNLMLKSLDHLSVRPLDAINLIRSLLKVKAHLIPMSEQPADLLAIDLMGNEIYGEVNVDQLTSLPQKLMLSPQVSCTPEALDAIHNADLIIIGPGSFLTSLMPLFLMNDLTQALQACRAAIIYIGNLGKELNQPAANMQLTEKIAMIEKHIGQQKIDAVIAGPVTDTSSLPDRIVLQRKLADQNVCYRHDRDLLRQAIEDMAHKIHQLKPFNLSPYPNAS